MAQISTRANEIAEGALFRRVLSGSLSEIAEVQEIGRDRMGITHVRFTAHLLRGSYAAANPEQRTLALESFCLRYKERLRFSERQA